MFCSMVSMKLVNRIGKILKVAICSVEIWSSDRRRDVTWRDAMVDGHLFNSHNHDRLEQFNLVVDVVVQIERFYEPKIMNYDRRRPRWPCGPCGAENEGFELRRWRRKDKMGQYILYIERERKKEIVVEGVQCDQMLNLKSCPNSFKSCLNNIHSSFYINWSFSK